jgi:hypothetical protein
MHPTTAITTAITTASAAGLRTGEELHAVPRAPSPSVHLVGGNHIREPAVNNAGRDQPRGHPCTRPDWR